MIVKIGRAVRERGGRHAEKQTRLIQEKFERSFHPLDGRTMATWTHFGMVGVFADLINCAKFGVSIFQVSDLRGYGEGQGPSHTENKLSLQLC